MASKLLMPAPVCLIENSPSKGLVVQKEALQLLSENKQPVVVVAIAGLYRTGKSYLMNRLAQQRKGFSLGSSVQSHTKGIWMWCVPHPCLAGHTLVLLDTEGLGDVEKGNTQNDTWIFVLAVLLSSTLIYNSRGTIDQQAMDQLHYVVELSEHIKLKAAPKGSEDELEDSEKFVLFFPTFIWALRDFTLQLELDGKEISEDEYLQNALKLKAGESPEVQRYNKPRECIRRYFRDRKCFAFEQPASRRKLARLEELQDSELSLEFQEQMEKLCRHIWEKSPPKAIPDVPMVTGRLLGKLATKYVEAIQNGTVPCLESAVHALAESENTAALNEAVRLYRELMEQRVKLPTETAQELLELHSQCQREALKLFLARAFKDGITNFQTELMRQVEEAKVQFCRNNEQASLEKCRAALRDIFYDMDRRITEGDYNVPGGYQLFKKDQQALEEKYQELPGKGVKADAVLLEFLQSRMTLVKSILHADHSLTEKEKELKSAQEQCERAEQEKEVKRKEEEEEKQKMQDQLRSSEESRRQLQRKLEDLLKKQEEEYDKMIKHKLEEERALRREGLDYKADVLEEAVRRLQEEQKKKRSFLQRCIDGLLWLPSKIVGLFKK